MNKEIEISPRQIAQAITDLLDEKEKLEQQNKELHNKMDKVIDIIECSRWDNGMYDISVDGLNHILKILKDDVDE